MNEQILEKEKEKDKSPLRNVDKEVAEKKISSLESGEEKATEKIAQKILFQDMKLLK